MRQVATNKDRSLTARELRYFGGQFSFWEKIKKKGIGSPKIIYESGIEYFDELKRNVEGEVQFVNFELLKNGLLLRLNVNQRFACIGAKLKEIDRINLIAYRIEIRHHNLGELKTK